MSAFGGKAEVFYGVGKSPLIARSGHWGSLHDGYIQMVYHSDGGELVRHLILVTGVLLAISLPKAYADDASDGRNLFIARCLGCHAFACNKIGPRLAGLFGRTVGTVEDYGYYSQGLKDADFVWGDKSLDTFFTDPANIFPKSVMARNGKIEDAVQRRQIIAFLKTEDSTVNICPQG